MPYVITTSRIIMGGYTVPGERESITESSRRAVATLEDRRLSGGAIEQGARTVTYQMVGDVIGWDDDSLDANELLYQAARLPESGGTVGPLPDGTVIEVEHWTHGALYNEVADSPALHLPADPTPTERDAAYIDAYNARES